MFKKKLRVHICFVAFCVMYATFTYANSQHSMEQSSRTRRQSAQVESQRIAPPGGINCPRNNLTSYNGKILIFRRQPGRTLIRVRTDWETTEQVVLRYAKNETPVKWFQLNGRRFKNDDWKMIESSKNRLLPHVRANIWVCADGSNPIVDWQPPVNE